MTLLCAACLNSCKVIVDMEQSFNRCDIRAPRLFENNDLSHVSNFVIGDVIIIGHCGVRQIFPNNRS